MRNASRMMRFGIRNASRKMSAFAKAPTAPPVGHHRLQWVENPCLGDLGAENKRAPRRVQSNTALTRQNLLLRRRSVTVSNTLGLPASFRRALVRLCSVTNQKVL